MPTVELNNLLEKIIEYGQISGRTVEELRAEIKFERESGLNVNPYLPKGITFVEFMESFEGENDVYPV